MSYQACENEAIRNAGRFMTEGHADVVKLEVDALDGGRKDMSADLTGATLSAASLAE